MKNSYFLLHIAVLFLGLSPVFGNLISLNEGLLTWYRLLFSTVILFIFIKFFKVDTDIKLIEKFNIGKIGILIAFSWIFFFAGIKYSNISIGVVCYCIASFFTAILEPLIIKRSFKLSEFLLSGITLVGIGLIFHFDSSYRIGILLGIISPFFYTLYSINNKKLVKSYDSKLINYYQMFGGTVGIGLILPIYLLFFPSQIIFPDLQDLTLLLLLSFFCTVLVYVFLTEAMKEISAFTANLTMNLEPIYAIIIAFCFFDEIKQMNFSFYIGLFLVILSVILQTFFSFRNKN